MARHANHHPTERELDILQVLWDREPATLGEICDELCRDREVAKTTVATLLKLMEDKRLVERTPDRKWQAAVSRGATSTKIVKSLLDKLFDGSASRLVAHVVKAGALSASDIDDLKNLLEAAETKQNAKRAKS